MRNTDAQNKEDDANDKWFKALWTMSIGAFIIAAVSAFGVIMLLGWGFIEVINWVVTK